MKFSSLAAAALVAASAASSVAAFAPSLRRPSSPFSAVAANGNAITGIRTSSSLYVASVNGGVASSPTLSEAAASLGLEHPPISLFGKGHSVADSVKGSGSAKAILGGKGANLAEMSGIGLSVPPGFTITTECCDG